MIMVIADCVSRPFVAVVVCVVVMRARGSVSDGVDAMRGVGGENWEPYNSLSFFFGHFWLHVGGGGRFG